MAQTSSAIPAPVPVTFSDLTPGDHTIEMTTTPEGYASAGSQTVTVVAGDTANLTFTLSVAPGRLDIFTQDADGNQLGGACYSINGGDPICDNDENDGNDNEGVIRVSGSGCGRLHVSQTTTPATFAPAADTTFTITAGERTRVDITLTPAFGAIEFTITDLATGNPIAGTCISSDGFSGEICDNSDSDGDPADGVILVSDVQPGVYSVNISTVPEGYAVAEGGENQVTVAAGETAPISRSIAEQKGSVTISFTDSGSGDPIADGVCVIMPANSSGTTYCDGDVNDLNGDPGKITLGNLDAGDYDLVVDSTADDYVLPETAFPFTIVAGQDTPLDIALEAVPPTETATEVPTETATEVPTETATEVPTDTETAVPEDTATETPVAEDTATETAVAEDTATESAEPKIPRLQQ